jgi:hypothetical protein
MTINEMIDHALYIFEIVIHAREVVRKQNMLAAQR